MNRELNQEDVDRHLRGFDSLVKTMFAVTEVRYHYQQITKCGPPNDMEALLRLQGLFSACVIAYGRVFSGQNGSRQLDEKIYPDELKRIHRRLMQFRDARFAHNLEHQTVESFVELVPDGEEYMVMPKMHMSLPYGPQADFDAVFSFLNAFLHDEAKRLAAKMSNKLGLHVRFADGPSPDWLGHPDE